MDIINKISERRLANMTRGLGKFVIANFKKVIEDKKAQQIDFQEHYSKTESEYRYGRIKYALKFDLREGKVYFNLRISPERKEDGIEKIIRDILPSNSQFEADQFLSGYSLQDNPEFVDLELRLKKIPEGYIDLYSHILGKVIKPVMRVSESGFFIH